MELDTHVEKTIFEILDNGTTDFKTGYEGFNSMDAELIKESILAMIPAGKAKLRRYRFLFDLPAEQIKLMCNEYYELILAEEELQKLLN